MRWSALFVLFTPGFVLMVGGTYLGQSEAGWRTQPSPPTTPCTGSGCGWSREQKRAHDLEALKARILNKLRLNGPPQVVAPSIADVRRVPSMDSLINECEAEGNASTETSGQLESGESVDSDAPTVVNVFHLADPNGPDVRIVRFPLQETRQDLRNLQSARFGVYVRNFHPSTSGVSVHVSRILRLSDGTNSPELESLEPRPTQYSNPVGRWLHWNVTSVVFDWIRNPSTNIGLFVNPSHASRANPNELLALNSSSSETFRPYLELRFREPDSMVARAPSRLRRNAARSTRVCDERTTHTHCCRFPLEVDFSTFGWDWIIAPRRALAYYCSGECQYLQQLTGTSVVSQMAGNLVVPCCYPTRTRELTILYQADNGTFHQSSIPDLIVDSCGCS